MAQTQNIVALTNRETIRDIFFGGLKALLVTDNAWLADFYNHQPTAEEIEGKSPIGWISSAGSEIENFTINTRKYSKFPYVIQVAIILGKDSDPDAVEDRLDLINAKIRGYFYHEDQYTLTGTYQGADLGNSVTGYSLIGGPEYRTETYPLSVEVKDD